ncbi:MAG: MCE family protein [Fimbriimonadaceae bacterium]|nr:MAG: MCE family protein [Fimbriimonadaceae bacterium]
MQSAWKVGGLVVIFAAMMMGVFAILKSSIFAQPTDTYFVRFADAGGLNSGAEVLLAGVSIGKVESVTLAEDGTARAKLSIEHGRTISKDIVAVLPTGFISLGDRQVLLERKGTLTGTYSPNNIDDPIPGAIKGPLEDIFPDTESTMQELNKTMVAFQNLLGDKELKDGLIGVMKSGEQTADKFGKLADSLSGTLNRNGDEIDALMTSMVAAMKNMQEVTAEINAYAGSGKLQAQADQLMTTMNSAAKQGELLVSDLRTYTSDPTIKDNLTGTLENFKSMSDSGVNIAQDAELMAKNGVEISDQTKQLMTKANKLADEVERLIEDVKGAVQKFGSGGGQSLIPEVNIESDLMYQSEQQRLRADVNLVIPAGREKLVLGLYDAFESNKLNVQFERALNERTDLRYGVYASKPGVGVSYAFAPNTWLKTELFGLNDPQFDIRLKHRFNQTIHGWVGIEDIFGRNSPAIGIGIKR